MLGITLEKPQNEASEDNTAYDGNPEFGCEWGQKGEDVLEFDLSICMPGGGGTEHKVSIFLQAVEPRARAATHVRPRGWPNQTLGIGKNRGFRG